MKPGMKLSLLLVSAVLLWGGLFCLMRWADNPKIKAQEVVQKALFALVSNPESIKIHAISEADSVFGREYISAEEKMAISMAMMKVNEQVMKATDDFENLDIADKELSALMERQMSAMSALRSLMSCESLDAHDGSQVPKKLTGWKVKIEYEALSEGRKPYRSEYWFILDKEAQCVVKSFEIPLL